MPPVLTALDPADTRPDLLVNREVLLGRLLEEVWAFLQRRDGVKGRAWTVHGEKGVGKTIFTRELVRRVRDRWTDAVVDEDDGALPVLAIWADCRKKATRRDVYQEILQEALRGLDELDSLGVAVSDELRATASIARAIARLSDATLRFVHESVLQHKAALGLTGDHAVLDTLKLNYGIRVDRSIKEVGTLEGSVSIDEDFLGQLVAALFSDLRDAGIRVLLHLDNIDELDHRYRSPEEREEVRRQVEGLLIDLTRGPAAIILNIRTYFGGVITREFDAPEGIEPLSIEDRLALLHRRLEEERVDVQDLADRPDLKQAVTELAAVCETPLAFLRIFQFLWSRDLLAPGSLRAGMEAFARSRFPTVSFEVLTRLLAAFPRATSTVGRLPIEAACEDDFTLRSVEEAQLVLPRDFWNPSHFTLDPVLQALHRVLQPDAA